MGKKKSKTPVKSVDIKEAGVDERPVNIIGLGAAHATALIGPVVPDLDNDRIVLPPEAFISSQLTAEELVAVALSNSQGNQEVEIPGLSGSAKKPHRSPQPVNLWHNLEDLRLVPPSSGLPQTDAGPAEITETLAALRIQEAYQSTSSPQLGGNSDRGRSPSRNNEIPQRSGAPEAMQIPSGTNATRDVLGDFREADRATKPDSTSRLAGSGNSSAMELPGRYLILARVWPGKIATGSVGLPSSILSSLGGDFSIGRSVLIYKVPNKAAVAGRDIDLHWLRDNAEQGEGSQVGPTTQASSVKGKTPTAVQWLDRVLSQEESSTKELFLLSTAWHLKGRLLLPGNPVALPVLGRSVVFQAALRCTEDNAWSYFEVEKSSKFQFLGSNEAAKEEDVFYAKAQAAATRAGEIAADVVGGGPEGPAASAAFQAAQMGVNALSTAESMEDIGGFRDQIAELHKFIILPLQKPEMFEEYGIQPPRGALLYGPPGTGKTRLAAAIAKDANVSLFVINGPDVLSGVLGHSEQGIQGVFAAAKASRPAVIFIDEIDALAPAREEHNDPHTPSDSTAATSASARVILTLSDEMAQANGVSVIAATNLPESLDPALLRPGRLDVEIEVGVPTPHDREAILRIHMKGLKHNLSEPQIKEIAKKTHGFVGADLSALCNEAAYSCLRRAIQGKIMDENQIWVTADDFKAAREEVGPSALRDFAIEIPDVKWEDIGGMETVKQRLKEMVEWPHKFGEQLRQMGVEIPKGVLLYGPPGCSKTMLAKAVATEAGLNFFSVKGGELFSKYVGDSEKAVVSLFKRARTNAPSVIFFDEIDGLVGSREDASATGGVENRVIGALLVAMDGLQDRGEVVVIAATNRPDILDPALLRPGRFDRLLYVSLPDLEAREQILKVRTKYCPLASDVDLHSLALSSDGFSGADISNLVREAGMAALDEDIEALEIAKRHFDAAFKVVGSSVDLSEETRKVYESFRRSM